MNTELRILMIEDSESDAALIARELKHGGLRARIRRVEMRDEITDALANETWDVIISDFNLPNFSAHKALKLVKESGLDLPILIVSGAIGEELAADLMRAGAHDVVLKDRLYRLVPAIERELREARDRKERRSAEVERAQALIDLRKAVQTRDEFLAIASHELKTPLTPVMMHVQILQREARRAEANALSTPLVLSHLEVVNRQLKRLDALMDKLLDVARIAHHRLTLEIQEMDLSQAMAEVATQISEQAKAAGCNLSVEIEPFVIGEWDPVRIEQIMMNLLSNALKYGEKKPVLISLEQRGEVAVVKVSDQGIGISHEDQGRIFERFERAVPLGEFAGIGVGLYITKLLIEAHGGWIEVESSPGKGATFTVYLPKHQREGVFPGRQLKRA